MNNVPLCPLHRVRMQAMLPERYKRTQRGLTSFAARCVRELAGWRRYRCPIRECPRVDAVEIPDAARIWARNHHRLLRRRE